MYNQKREFKHDISQEGYDRLETLGKIFLLSSWAILVIRALVHGAWLALAFNVVGVGFWLWVIAQVWMDFRFPDLRRGGRNGWLIGLAIALAYVVYVFIALGGWIWFVAGVYALLGIGWLILYHGML